MDVSSSKKPLCVVVLSPEKALCGRSFRRPKDRCMVVVLLCKEALRSFGWGSLRGNRLGCPKKALCGGSFVWTRCSLVFFFQSKEHGSCFS